MARPPHLARRSLRTHGAPFYVELIRPSHYDDRGYVIQWVKAWMPSNALACLYGLAQDVADRRTLGADVDVIINAYDEGNRVIRVQRIIKRIQRAGGRGLVCLVGVQSNQFPRAVDLARRFRAAGVQVAIGGFHVSGCIAMLPSLPADLQEALDLGITLFAGEAEGRFEDLLRAAYEHRLEPIYNYLNDAPSLAGAVVPYLPRRVTRRYASIRSTFEAGRGCPFLCSFCTIINVQGRKSRYRTADDVERILRANLKQGIYRYFLTDDNLARNQNWEAILDRIAALRAELGVKFNFTIQVDTLCHKIPNFVAKARRAGVSRAFIGLESINPDSLKSARKTHNQVANYSEMLLAWQRQKVTTQCGFILGFPNETPEQILADIETIKRDLPVDLLEFFFLTPLPGSADHKALVTQGAPLDPDMNIYDQEHVCAPHARMSKEEWESTYRRAWDSYYSMDHLATLMRRSAALGKRPKRIMEIAVGFYGSVKYEGVHPLQAGFIRRKIRTERRPTFPREHPLVFYPHRVMEFARTYLGAAAYGWRVWRLYRRVMREMKAAREPWVDEAIRPALVVPDREDRQTAARSA